MSNIDPNPEPEQSEGSQLREKLEGTLDENADLKRRLAFSEANIDPTSDEGALITQIVGEDVTAETITAARERIAKVGGGTSTPPEPEAETEETEVETPDAASLIARDQALAAQETRNELTGVGGKLPDPPAQDALEEGFQRYTDLRKAGKTEEDARSAVIGALFADVAERGDQSPRSWNGWDHLEETQSV